MSTNENTGASADTLNSQVATEPEKPKAAEPEKPKTRIKRVRILYDTTVEGRRYKVDQVVDFEAPTAASLEKAQHADGNPAAVAYALSRGAQPIVHKPSED